MQDLPHAEVISSTTTFYIILMSLLAADYGWSVARRGKSSHPVVV